MAESAPESPAPPLPNTYWIEPGRLLAGEVPGVHFARRYAVSSQQAAQCWRYLLSRSHRAGRARAVRRIAIEREGGEQLALYDQPILTTRYRLRRRPWSRSTNPTVCSRRGTVCTCIATPASVARARLAGCYFVHRGMLPDAALDHVEFALACQPALQELAAYAGDRRAVRVRAQVARRSGSTGPPRTRADLGAARVVRDRYLGALLGLAAGDALGAAVQYRVPGSFTPLGDLLGGGPFEMPRGAGPTTRPWLCASPRAWSSVVNSMQPTRWRAIDAGSAKATSRAPGSAWGSLPQWRAHSPRRSGPASLSRAPTIRRVTTRMR